MRKLPSAGERLNLILDKGEIVRSESFYIRKGRVCAPDWAMNRLLTRLGGRFGLCAISLPPSNKHVLPKDHLSYGIPVSSKSIHLDSL